MAQDPLPHRLESCPLLLGDLNEVIYPRWEVLRGDRDGDKEKKVERRGRRGWRGGGEENAHDSRGGRMMSSGERKANGDRSSARACGRASTLRTALAAIFRSHLLHGLGVDLPLSPFARPWRRSSTPPRSPWPSRPRSPFRSDPSPPTPSSPSTAAPALRSRTPPRTCPPCPRARVPLPSGSG